MPHLGVHGTQPEILYPFACWVCLFGATTSLPPGWRLFYHIVSRPASRQLQIFSPDGEALTFESQ